MLDDAGLVSRSTGVPAFPDTLGKRSLTRESELIGAGFLVLGASFLYPYLKGVVDGVTPGCLFHRLTGLPCLLCGMTRSFAATAHGRWEEAFRMHLLGPPLFLIVAAATSLLVLERMLAARFLPRPGRDAMRKAAWLLLALLALAWVLRLAVFGVNV